MPKSNLLKWGMSVLAMGMLVACGGNSSSSHATGLSSSSSHATGLSSSSESSESSESTGEASSESTGEASSESTSSDDEGRTGFFLRGAMNEWAADPDYEFIDTGVEGIKGTLAEVLIRDGQTFKIADANWQAEWYYKEEEVEGEAAQYFVSSDPSAEKPNYKCIHDGYYKVEIKKNLNIAFTLLDKEVPALGQKEYFIVGSLNGESCWSADTGIAMDGTPAAGYQAAKAGVHLYVNDEFKILEKTLQTWLGYSQIWVETNPDSFIQADTDDNIKVVKEGIFDFALTDAGKLEVTVASVPND